MGMKQTLEVINAMEADGVKRFVAELALPIHVIYKKRI